MNLRIMPKLVVGTLLTSAALGMTTCCNRANSKNEPTKDVFVKTETVDDLNLEKNTTMMEYESESIEEEIERLPKVTHERNPKCEARTSWDYERTLEFEDSELREWAKDKIAQRTNLYDTRGTYGTSMTMQKASDYIIKYQTMQAAESYFKIRAAKQAGVKGYKIETIFDKFMEDHDDPEIQDYLKIPAVQDYIAYEFYNGQQKYISYTEEEEKLIESDEHMFNNRPLSATECLGYLDDQLANIDNLSMDDYEKIIDDVENFAESKRPLTVEDMAEVVAFKQYKTDSVTTRAYFRDNGWWSPEIRKRFEDICNIKRNQFFK